MTQLKQALKSLGYSGKATAMPIAYKRSAVCVNGKLVGVWDAARNTFVD